MIHQLKVASAEVITAIDDERKTFEVRVDDRDPPFKVGDTLILRHDRRGVPQVIARNVTYVLRGAAAERYGVMRGYCIMSIEAEESE